MDLDAILSAVKNRFRPEFLNRIRRQIVFRPLTHDVLRKIVSKLVASLNERLRDKHIVVRLSPEAEGRLLAEGCDEVYGARALERAFEKQISNRLAADLLASRVQQGDQLLVVMGEQGYAFRRN